MSDEKKQVITTKSKIVNRNGQWDLLDEVCYLCYAQMYYRVDLDTKLIHKVCKNGHHQCESEKDSPFINICRCALPQSIVADGLFDYKRKTFSLCSDVEKYYDNKQTKLFPPGGCGFQEEGENVYPRGFREEAKWEILNDSCRSCDTPLFHHYDISGIHHTICQRGHRQCTVLISIKRNFALYSDGKCLCQCQAPQSKQEVMKPMSRFVDEQTKALSIWNALPVRFSSPLHHLD